MAYNDLRQQSYGSGELYFSRFTNGTTTPIGGRRYLGNTKEFSLSLSSDRLDHFDTDHGIKEKDDSIVVSTAMSGKFVGDNLNDENLALFFLGTSGSVAGTSTTALILSIAAIAFDTYQLGVTTANPTGDRKVTNVVVKNAVGGPTTYVAGTDYVVDLAAGTVTFIAGGTIAAGGPAYITYDRSVSTRSQIISNNNAVEGALWFKSFNPKGPKRDLWMPRVSLAPDGDFNLKGDDWLSMGFMIDVLRLGTFERLYIDGEAA